MKENVISKRSIKALDTHYRSKYGIGVNQFKALLEEQNGRCFICGEEHWRNLAVDHNHKTGKVRKLLCSKCNMAIGLLNDNADLLRKCAEYVDTEFELPVDTPIQPVKQTSKKRWRRVVTTPKGIFSSLELAAKAFGVDNSTMGVWCGAYTYYSASQKEGFSQERVFLSMEEVDQQYNIVE